MDREKIVLTYQKILDIFLSGSEEKAFYRVDQLSRKLVLQQQGPDVLIDIHNEVLKKAVLNVEPFAVSKLVVNANDLLLNAIMGYASTYYSFLEQMEAQKAKLKQANEKLKELDRLKSMFISSMSHELRTPLNSIIGFSGIMLQGILGDLNEDQKDVTERVYRSGNHLLALVNDIIDISKIESGNVTAYPESFLLSPLAEEAIDTVSIPALEKGLTLRKKLPPEDVTLFTDRRRLLQCLINYLGNAVKFTEKGRITLQVMVQDNENIIFTVTDTGIGIDKKNLSDLFQSFSRILTPQSASVPGTGLGLYLTRKLAREILCGDTWAESTLGQGSIFGLTLPMKLEDEQ